VTLFAADTGRSTESITVVEAIDLSVVPAPSEPRLDWKAAPHENSTCVIWNGTRLAVDFRSSFPSAERGYLEMTSDIDGAVAPELANQFFCTRPRRPEAPPATSLLTIRAIGHGPRRGPSTCSAIAIA
jgi:hypothetical protein